MARTAMQKHIEKVTGASRFTTGSAKRHSNRMKKQIRNKSRRKSNGGSGG